MLIFDRRNNLFVNINLYYPKDVTSRSFIRSVALKWFVYTVRALTVRVRKFTFTQNNYKWSFSLYTSAYIRELHTTFKRQRLKNKTLLAICQ